MILGMNWLFTMGSRFIHVRIICIRSSILAPYFTSSLKLMFLFYIVWFIWSSCCHYNPIFPSSHFDLTLISSHHIAISISFNVHIILSGVNLISYLSHFRVIYIYIHVFGNSGNFWYHQGRLTCYLDSPMFSVLWAVFWCHVNVIFISWRFVSCHLILSNLITLCSYVMHFRSRGRDRASFKSATCLMWPCAHNSLFTLTPQVVARYRRCASIHNLRSREL